MQFLFPLVIDGLCFAWLVKPCSEHLLEPNANKPQILCSLLVVKLWPPTYTDDHKVRRWLADCPWLTSCHAWNSSCCCLYIQFTHGCVWGSGMRAVKSLCCGLAALAVQRPCWCGSLRPAPIHRSGSVDPIVSCVTTHRAANKGRLAPSLNIAAN